MSFLVAHVGHWYHVLLYHLPILLIGAGLWRSNRSERRREREAELGSQPRPPQSQSPL